MIGLNKPLWLDEVYSINIIQVKSVGQLIRNFYNGADTNPPFYFILIYFIQKLTRSIIYIRLFSLILSIIGLYFLFKLLKNFVDREIIILIFLILSISYFYAQYLVVEIRPYALFFLLSVLFINQYYKISIINDKKLINSLFFLVVTISLLYTHYFAFYYVLLILIIELWNRKRNYYIIISIIISLLLFLPWLTAIKNQLSIVHGKIWQEKPTFFEIIKLPTLYFNTFSSLLLLILIVISLFKQKINFTHFNLKFDNYVLLIISYSIFPFINIILTNFNLSVSEPRYYIPSYVSYIFILAIVLNHFQITNLKLYKLLFTIFLVLSGFYRIELYYNNQLIRRNDINSLLKLNELNVPILCESTDEFYPLNYYAKLSGNSNFYFVLDKQSSELNGNVKSAGFDYYWSKGIQHFYMSQNLIPIKEVINRFDSFYLINETQRRIFENRFENNPSYLCNRLKGNIFFIRKIK